MEALARSGVGALDLIDNDTVSLTNLNRQIIALHDTIGRQKTEVAAERVRAINPDCAVTLHNVFYLPETADRFDFTQYDYIVDAIDTVSGKLRLIQSAKEAGVPIICSMGTGNKLDPTKLAVDDISRTSVCPLAKVMRYECRKRGLKKVKVVYSTEEPVKPDVRAEKDCDAEKGKRRVIPGSTAFVPAAAGLIIAAQVVKDLTEGK